MDEEYFVRLSAYNARLTARTHAPLGYCDLRGQIKGTACTA